MQILLILNELNLFSGNQHAIGEVRIINAKGAKEINPSNEELLYNWAMLNKYSPVKNDKFKSGKIKTFALPPTSFETPFLTAVSSSKAVSACISPSIM